MAVKAGVPVWFAILVALSVGTVVPVVIHHQLNDVWNIHFIGCVFFLWLNVIIAFWEICLFLKIDLIDKEYKQYAIQYKGRELKRVADYMFTRIPLTRLLSPSVWAGVWSTYSIFDESYANKKSFGFFIDIGNGFSTLIPSALCIYAMTYSWLPPRAIGLVMLIINYQMWYGTLIYFTSYVVNRRWRGHSPLNVALFVGVTNGMWFTFPLWGIACALSMIYTDSYTMLLA